MALTAGLAACALVGLVNPGGSGPVLSPVSGLRPVSVSQRSGRLAAARTTGAADPDWASDGCRIDVAPVAVTALGRLQPRGGVIRVAGPSQPAAVVAALHVADGDLVERGQILAVLDDVTIHAASVARWQAELELRQAEYRRYRQLHARGITSASERDTWRTNEAVARAELARAEALRDNSIVRAPATGRILDIHTRPGERIGRDGILELGDVDQMSVVAEVYETDLQRVEVGQKVTVVSAALPEELHGEVEKILWTVAQEGLRSLDPTSPSDLRVVVVKVLLDKAEVVRFREALTRLINLQVDVYIEVDKDS
jgi:HlyD family secretion protein